MRFLVDRKEPCVQHQRFSKKSTFQKCEHRQRGCLWDHWTISPWQPCCSLVCQTTPSPSSKPSYPSSYRSSPYHQHIATHGRRLLMSLQHVRCSLLSYYGWKINKLVINWHFRTVVYDMQIYSLPIACLVESVTHWITASCILSSIFIHT